MNVSVICTGTELLKGTTVNTNMAFLGSKLAEIGIVVHKAVIVGDSPDDMKKAMSELLNESDVIVTTGGLGPTKDDLTRNAVSEIFGLNQKMDEEIATDLRCRWISRRRGEPPDEFLTQAMVPENSEVLENRVGTAPGLWVEGSFEGVEKVAVLLPGPPSELNPMVTEQFIPRMKNMFAGGYFTESFMVSSAAELIVQQQIEPLVDSVLIEMAYCASAEGVKVFFSGKDRELLRAKAEDAKKLFGSQVLEDDQLSVVAEISERVRRAGIMLATAESCTGGMISSAFTDLAGSSDIFMGAVVAYSNQIKQNVLGVPEDILVDKGAVSPECAEAMVDGLCKFMKTQAGISVTGIAGPGGGTPDKPVGLVYIGAKVNDRIEVQKHNFNGDRSAVRERTCARALLLLRKLLLEEGY
jgi:nicotinamide-nucleotide amidase